VLIHVFLRFKALSPVYICVHILFGALCVCARACLRAYVYVFLGVVLCTLTLLHATLRRNNSNLYFGVWLLVSKVSTRKYFDIIIIIIQILHPI
jgi:hypothetical protein